LSAIEEMRMNPSIPKCEFYAFEDKCKELPVNWNRKIFGKERRVKSLAYYTAANLFSFANKRIGKKDDISVCAGILV